MNYCLFHLRSVLQLFQACLVVSKKKTPNQNKPKKKIKQKNCKKQVGKNPCKKLRTKEI